MWVGIVMGQLWGSTVKRAGGWGASICSSVMSSHKKLARFVGSVGILPKSSAKSKQTCFCTRSEGGYSATGLSRE